MKKLILFFVLYYSLIITHYSLSQSTLIQLTNGTNDRNPVFTNYNYSYNADGNEVIFMGFERTTGSLSQILVEKIGPTGPLDSGVIIISNTYTNRNPSITFNHPSYPYFVVRKGLITWESNKNGNWDIYASRYNYATGWSAPFPVDTTSGDQINACISYLDSTFISIAYQSGNDVKFKRYNLETNTFSSDSNLTFTEPLVCGKPFVQTLERTSGKIILVAYEKDINTSQKAIYFTKGTLSGNTMSWTAPDTIAFTGINRNPSIGNASSSMVYCYFETTRNGTSDIYTTILLFYNNTKAQQPVISNNSLDDYSYSCADLILGDDIPIMFYGYLRKSNNEIKAYLRLQDSLVSTVSTNTSYSSKISRGLMWVYSFACERMWIVFNKESQPQYTSRIFGSHVTSCAMNIKKISSIADKFGLEQNYPNPFNPNTIIRFQIKDSRFVALKVYDITGREIAVLINEKIQPGEYETQFPNNSITSNQLPSGVYFYTLFADGERVDTKKMLMIK